MHVRFEWDAVKAASNLAKHGVSFEEAIEVFADPWALMTQDRIESEDGDGMEVIRIVSARTADRKERKRYENQNR